MAGSVWVSLTYSVCSNPPHPLVAKPSDDWRTQYKLRSMWCPAPKPAHPLVVSSRPGDRLPGGEARQEACSTLVLQVLASAVSGLSAMPVLESVLIFTHYMYNLPQICH